MTASITVSRSDATSPTDPGAFRMDISIDSSDNITSYLFVKQRTANAAGYTDDFVCVATATDIEDYPETAPEETTGYFRDTAVSLISESIDDLNTIFNEMVSLLQTTCKQVDDLQNTSPTSSVTITANSISAN